MFLTYMSAPHHFESNNACKRLNTVPGVTPSQTECAMPKDQKEEGKKLSLLTEFIIPLLTNNYTSKDISSISFSQ